MNDARKTIGWCDKTWNPVTGCYHKCPYCYAQNIAHRFKGFTPWADPEWVRHVIQTPYGPVFELDEVQVRHRKDGKVVPAPFPYEFLPTFHRYRLDEPTLVTKPQTIFVGSMCDLFGKWVPTYWIREVLDATGHAPQHRYLFLTKDPEQYLDLHFPVGLPSDGRHWYGMTVTREEDIVRIPYGLHGLDIFWSVEPILGLVDIKDARGRAPKWIILGAETGNRKGKVVPRREWVDAILRSCDEAAIPVFMKESMVPIMGEEAMRREFPWEMD